MRAMSVPTPKIEDTRSELNCNVVGGVLVYVERGFGRAALFELLEALGMPLSYLQDGGNWISYDFFNRLLETMIEQTGNPDAAYEAGLCTGDPGTFAIMRVFASHLLTVRSVYRLTVRYHQGYSKISEATFRDLGRSRAILEMRYPHGHRQTRVNCDNIRGQFAALPKLVGQPLAQVVHTDCILNGAEACVYEISWREKPLAVYALTGAVAGVLLGASCLWLDLQPLGPVWLMSALGVAGFAVGHARDLKKNLKAISRHNDQEAQALIDSIHTIEELNVDLQARVEARTRELSAANRKLQDALEELGASREKALMAERQAAVGVLASGMAHEMNSPINAIRLSVQALIEDVGPDSPLLALLENTERATTRCKHIVNDLLSFSRETQPRRRVSLEDIVRATIARFAKEHTDTLQVTTVIEPGGPRLRLDHDQIQQALLNILANAADAMSGSGHIEVHLAANANAHVLTIEDDGPGMPEDVRKRIFEPFFTTKTEGLGTGLGLSITWQLIHRNGGTVEVSDSEANGTRFEIRFPIRDNGAGAQAGAREQVLDKEG